MFQSLCLYDEGEEHWPVKLHLGCGGIFLRGYRNVDIDGLDAKTNPATAQANSADVRDYYAGLDGDAHHLPVRRLTVVDLTADIVELPYTPRTVDKILAVQVFEHLSPVRAMDALYHWHRILKVGSPLVMSVPDMAGILDMMDAAQCMYNDSAVADFAFALRHLRGRRTNHYNSHHAWYTSETLCELLDFCGFKTTLLPNFHFYPAIVARAVRQ